jgi:Ca2+-binding EF-hand superfamily protein
MDDLDSIIEAVRAKGPVNKKEFSALVTQAVKGKPMSKEEVALLFRVFDANKNAVLELSELMKLEELHDSLGDSDHMGHHLDRS